MTNRRSYRTCLKNIQGLSLKQLLVIVVTIIMIWLCLLLYICDRTKSKDEQLKEEIIDLSKRYVHALALQQHRDVDGPYAGRFTGYDLKKTFAVLLQNMLERLDILESKVFNLTRNGKLQNNNNNNNNNNSSINNVDKNVSGQTLRNPLASQNKVDYADLIKGAQERCVLDLEKKLRFPECDDKIEWMHKHWQSHSCYKENGVDGSLCSITIYLSEIEQYCPRLSFREQNSVFNETETMPFADISQNLTYLLDKLNFNSNFNSFMKRRITTLWPRMIAAGRKLNNTPYFQERSMKNIVIYMGFLSKASKLKISENIFKGGPLGELVQWTDLISGLYVAGHEILIFNEVEEINKYLSGIPNLNIPCQSKIGARLDILFTDIIGFNQIFQKLEKFKCIVRILDTFGTQSIYNNQYYLKKLKIKPNGWMGKMFELKQFYNMYPHTPDNTFLGFIVESPEHDIVYKKKKIALVYGKHYSMWKNIKPYLDLIKQYFEIHATVGKGEDTDKNLPSYVINHGILFGSNYTSLLKEAMIFIGIGFPYEGPAPLEAIAYGVSFLNPKFNSKQSEDALKFFKGKPTKRKLYSQHPYIEKNIGEPFSYLVDIKNATMVSEICKKIIKKKLKRGFVPFEFTEIGFIQRLSILIEKQIFCQHPYSSDPIDEFDQWPSIKSAHFFLGIVNQSCEETCVRQNLICESSYIERMMNNRLELQQRGVWCEHVRFDGHPVHPSYNPYTKTCYFQTDHFLISCSDTLTDHMRFCGCRDFIEGQSAVCKTCL